MRKALRPLLSALAAATLLPATAGARPPVPEVASPLPVRLEWRHDTLGYGVGKTGLHVVDLDGDGALEIVAGATANVYPALFMPSDTWYALGRVPGGYEHVWFLDDRPDRLFALEVAQLDDDPALEVIALGGDWLDVYDGRTRALERRFPLPFFEDPRSPLVVADVDGDGEVEFVYCIGPDAGISAARLRVQHAVTGAIEHSAALPVTGRTGLAVGNVDRDPGLEIVVGTDVLDGASRAVEWTNSAGFGEWIELNDPDGRGRAEIVAAGFTYGLRGFDAAQRAQSWSIPVGELSAMRVRDVDGDGTTEILFAEFGWGAIHVLDGATRVQRWELPNPEFGATNFAVGDVDGDGTTELVWGAGNNSTGRDRFFVADTVTREVEWASEDVVGPFYGLTDGDVDADGRPELVYSSRFSDSHYGDGRFFVRDAITKDLEFAPLGTTGENWHGVWRVRAANVDADPQLEILVATNDVHTPVVICYDGLTHEEQWRYAGMTGLDFVGLEIADLDGDGALEAVVSTDRVYSSIPGNLVVVIDAGTGSTVWTSPYLFGAARYSLLEVANVDADLRLEIVVGGVQQGIDRPFYVFDPGDASSGPAVSLGSFGPALDVADLDGDAIAEILVGTNSGAVRAVDPVTGQVRRELLAFAVPVEGIVAADLTGDAVPDFVLTLDRELFVVDGATGVARWRSGELEFPGLGVEHVAATDDSVMVADIDGDGRLEIAFNAGRRSVRVYEVEGPGLGAGHLRLPSQAQAGGELVFRVAITNPGLGVVSGATLVDTLPDGTSYVGASGAACEHDLGQVVCAVPEVASRGQAVVAIRTRVGVVGGTLTNEARVETRTGDPPVTSSATARVRPLLVSAVGAAASESAVAVPITLVLSYAVPWDVTATWRTVDGTAAAGSDYVARQGVVTFPAGARTASVQVPVVADGVSEPLERFTVELAGVTGARPGPSATVVIRDASGPRGRGRR
jgi:uncharacterized repeat protein (TIGR01451 family)